MTVKEKLEALRLRAGTMWREHKERAAEKRAERQAQADAPNVTVPLWLVNATKFASWVATVSLMYFLWLYTLDIARDRAGSLHLTHAGQWIGEINFWFPYVVGFAIVAFGIPYVAKIAIPTFMSLSWRGNFWPKLWALIIALAVSLVVIAGTFAVQGDTLMERDREAAVAVEGVQQGRAAIQAQIDGITEDLRASTEGNSTQAQAARVGMLAGSVEAARAQWQGSYVQPAEAAGDANTERIRRATGSAEAAAAAVARREALRQQLAASPTVASVQGEVTTARTTWIADALGWLEGVRAILLSLVMDIVALMMPWIALRLEQTRNRQMGMAEGIPQHPWMITDQKAGRVTPEEVDKMAAQEIVDIVIQNGGDPRLAAHLARATQRKAARETTLKDAKTDELIVDKDGHLAKKVREHTRKVKSKDGQPIQIIMPAADPGPEEAPGDGGMKHLATSIPGVPDISDLGTAVAPQVPNVDPQDHQANGNAAVGDGLRDDESVQVHEPSEPPELSDEQLAALGAAENIEAVEPEASQPEDQPASDDAADNEEPQDQIADHSDRPEPETREDRLLPSVAAE